VEKFRANVLKANEVNYLAVSSQQVQRTERRLDICKPSKGYVGIAGIPNSCDFFAALWASDVVSTVINTQKRYCISHGMRQPCNFHFRYVADKICLLCKVISLGASLLVSFAAWQMRSCLLRQNRRLLVYLIFCLDILWVYTIEVNSLAVWSKRVKRFKGKLICWGKQELARTCSVYINAQDNHSKFTVVA